MGQRIDRAINKDARAIAMDLFNPIPGRCVCVSGGIYAYILFDTVKARACMLFLNIYT